MATLTWTASNGSAIEIEARIGIGGAVLVARIDGKQVASHYGPTILKTPVAANGQSVVASIGKVGLTAERYALVREIYEPIKAQYAKSLENLGEIRRDLVERLVNIRIEADDAANDRIERAIGTGIYSGGADYSTKERAAVDALAAFDAAHPEIIDAIRADRSAAAERYAEIN